MPRSKKAALPGFVCTVWCEDSQADQSHKQQGCRPYRFLVQAKKAGRIARSYHHQAEIL